MTETREQIYVVPPLLETGTYYSDPSEAEEELGGEAIAFIPEILSRAAIAASARPSPEDEDALEVFAASIRTQERTRGAKIARALAGADAEAIAEAIEAE